MKICHYHSHMINALKIKLFFISFLISVFIFQTVTSIYVTFHVSVYLTKYIHFHTRLSLDHLKKKCACMWQGFMFWQYKSLAIYSGHCIHTYLHFLILHTRWLSMNTQQHYKYMFKSDAQKLKSHLKLIHFQSGPSQKRVCLFWQGFVFFFNKVSPYIKSCHSDSINTCTIWYVLGNFLHMYYLLKSLTVLY